MPINSESKRVNKVTVQNVLFLLKPNEIIKKRWQRQKTEKNIFFILFSLIPLIHT